MRLRRGRAVLCCVLVLLGCAAPAHAQLVQRLLGPQRHGHQLGGPSYANPVLAGDYPDPSVIHTSEGWWAVVTSGGWRPPFTILHSTDLVNWAVAGHVLRGRPAWAKTDFWAPEITRFGDRFVVYYSALSRKGRRCIGVASSSRAIGWYHDHGPVVCSHYGSIDPQAVLDEAGRAHLLWKDDGNAHRQPAAILGAPLTAGGLKLGAAPRELFHNDTSWEGRLVEAPTLTHHGNKLYMLYSARACCGPRCEYVTGVARSEHLFGRWEKFPGPILAGNSLFRCPGHGTVVDAPGSRQYFVYHAYSTSEPLIAGRQLLLDRLDWTPAGWPVVHEGDGPSGLAASPLGAYQRERRSTVVDEFDGRWVGPAWGWPTDKPRMELQRRGGGRLLLGTSRQRGKPPPGVQGRRGNYLPGIVGRQPGAIDYRAEVLVGRSRKGARPGLAVFAAREKALGVELRGRSIVVWRAEGARETLLASIPAPNRRPTFRVTATGGDSFTFELATPGGWRPVGPARYRPPLGWAVPRIVLRVAGPPGARAAFERFKLQASG
jgi:xylan 1,4-beta-xylosidase